MDLPAEIQIHSQIMGLKGGKGTLVAISPEGYYETKCVFGGKTHRVLFPIENTVIIFRQPEAEFGPGVEIER